MNFLTKKWTALSGYKTYFLGGLTIVGAIVSWVSGDVTLLDAAKLVVPAVMGMTVRHGITEETSVPPSKKK